MRRVKFIAALLGLIFTLTACGITAAHAAAPASAGPFTTSGAQILDNGQPWVPRGVTVSGLEHAGPPRLREFTVSPSWRRFAASDLAQIRAAASAWHANVIRLQISQAMVDSGIQAFMSQLHAEVALAQSLGMAVVFNDNTEWDTGGKPIQVSPATDKFWKIISEQYASDPGVMFDLLNEPSLGWKQWQGEMTWLAAYVHKLAPRTLMWVEGPDGASTLAWLDRYPVHVPDVVFVIHHPAGAHTVAGWQQQFGYLAAQGIPVVVGEWSNWSAQRSECWPDAPTAVPAFLAYLSSLHVGMTIWALGWSGVASSGYPGNYAGPAVLANGSYSVPVSFGSDWSCTNGLREGAGADVMAWYQQEASS